MYIMYTGVILVWLWSDRIARATRYLSPTRVYHQLCILRDTS